jgi:hypothetical protein
MDDNHGGELEEGGEDNLEGLEEVILHSGEGSNCHKLLPVTFPWF